MSKSADNLTPTPELLAAYLDGELEGHAPLAATKEQVEAWLSAHSEAAADVAAHKRLNQLWQATSPADPVHAWDSVAGNIAAALAQPASAAPRGRWPFFAGATVAASLALVWLSWTWSTDAPPGAVPGSRQAQTAVAPLPVAAEGEIEILSIAGEDTTSLPVGTPPVHERLVVAKPGEVVVTSVQTPEDEHAPEMVQTASAAIIWTRLERVPKNGRD